MALNTLFPRQRELVNYDYFDIAEGVGYVVYYGLVGDDGEYLIATNSNIYSEEICSYLFGGSITTSFTKKFDFDFDLMFNRPKNIKGVITANVPLGITGTSASKDYEMYVVVKVYHVNGGETLLATGTSKTISVTLANAALAHASFIAACRCDVTTLKHFKKGETLRFTVEGWFKISTNDTANIYMCHDPKNRSFKNGAVPGLEDVTVQFANEESGGGTLTYQNTQMIFHVPFVLDI